MLIQLSFRMAGVPRVLPDEHYRWFYLANCARNPIWKRERWYPFKERFLPKYGFRDGCDLQVLRTGEVCFGCGGQGCARCDWGGEYVARVVLERWQLPSLDVYHKPLVRVEEREMGGIEVKNVIEGRVKHDPAIREEEWLWSAERLFREYRALAPENPRARAA